MILSQSVGIKLITYVVLCTDCIGRCRRKSNYHIQVVVRFVDIGGIVDRHCLNFLFIIQNVNDDKEPSYSNPILPQLISFDRKTCKIHINVNECCKIDDGVTTNTGSHPYMSTVIQATYLPALKTKYLLHCYCYVMSIEVVSGLWCLMPLSTIFQLYCGS